MSKKSEALITFLSKCEKSVRSNKDANKRLLILIARDKKAIKELRTCSPYIQLASVLVAAEAVYQELYIKSRYDEISAALWDALAEELHAASFRRYCNKLEGQEDWPEEICQVLHKYAWWFDQD